MYKIEIDLNMQCGECEEYHYTVYEWNGNIWENIISDTAETPERCFFNGYTEYQKRMVNNESK